jgi:hypothetical protein
MVSAEVGRDGGLAAERRGLPLWVWSPLSTCMAICIQLLDIWVLYLWERAETLVLALMKDCVQGRLVVWSF